MFIINFIPVFVRIPQSQQALGSVIGIIAILVELKPVMIYQPHWFLMIHVKLSSIPVQQPERVVSL